MESLLGQRAKYHKAHLLGNHMVTGGRFVVVIVVVSGGLLQRGDAVGLIHMDFLEYSTTIQNTMLEQCNVDYAEFRSRRRKSLHYDNANTCISLMACELDFTILPYLTPWNLNLFSKLKQYFCGHLFDANKEMELLISV